MSRFWLTAQPAPKKTIVQAKKISAEAHQENAPGAPAAYCRNHEVSSSRPGTFTPAAPNASAPIAPTIPFTVPFGSTPPSQAILPQPYAMNTKIGRAHV